jgi:hypothetical protein|tara:strand:- start:26 stop:580 length:555 start_codon:yes stop_codon:yes gene_type:complete
MTSDDFVSAIEANQIESYEHHGATVAIYQDDDPGNPRTDWDQAGTMWCEHGRYDLGDKDARLVLEDAVASLAKSTDHPDYQDMEDFNWGDNADLVEAAVNLGIVILPLFLYDHSGITMSCAPFSCPWDSGQVGVIFMTPEAGKEWEGNSSRQPAGLLHPVHMDHLGGDGMTDAITTDLEHGDAQ